MPRLTYANVTASLALFIALGGTSYAAVKIKKDSVTTREVKDASLLAADLAPGVLGSGPAGPRGPRGAEGPAGPQGDRGVQGDRGPASVLFTAPASAKLSASALAPVKVASMTNVPAGSYLVVFTGEATLRVANAGMYVLCETKLNGSRISLTKGIVGDAYGGDEVLSDMTTVSRNNAFDLSVECYPDQNFAAQIDAPKLALIATGAITNR